jgi:hypothetical protein
MYFMLSCLLLSSQEAFYQGLKGISDALALQFLIRGPQDPLAAQAVERLATEHVKAMNISRQWLHTCLPHVLTKVDRVSFGLLTADDIEVTELRESSAICYYNKLFFCWHYEVAKMIRTRLRGSF